MKRRNILRGVCVALAVLAGGSGLSAQAASADEKAAGAVRATTEYENARVRVVRYVFGPHARVPMHDAPDLVAVWLTDGRLKLTFPDGTWKEMTVKAGQVGWEAAQRHEGENEGSTPLEFISVQMK